MSITAKDIERIVYRTFRAAWEKDRGGWIAPPNIVFVTELTQCLRKSWFNRAFSSPPGDEKIVVLVLGDDVHYLMNTQFPLGEGEYSVEKEYKGVIIKGRIDRVVGDVIVEFKTASRLPDEPYEMHLDQLQLYLWLSGRKRGFIVYVSKTNGKIKVFEIDRDDERIDILLEKALAFSNCLKEGKAPLPEPGWLCKVCEYVEHCSIDKSRGKTS